ncbi:MAG: 30S ribosomal protein S16 [Chitinophagales bacterium]
MATRLRLQRHGAKGAPFYKIVAADSRAKRDGKYIEQIGTYNPTSVPATIILDVDKAVKWLQNGAEPTSTVKAILSYKGAMYKKHLLRGVTLGVVKAEDVETKFNEWATHKEGKVLDHKTNAEAKKKEKHASIVNAPAKAKPVAEVAQEEATTEETTETTEASTETNEAAE